MKHLHAVLDCVGNAILQVDLGKRTKCSDVSLRRRLQAVSPVGRLSFFSRVQSISCGRQIRLTDKQEDLEPKGSKAS